MLDDLPFDPPKPSAERPLAGLTVLLVEDSRFASEAIRLLCLRSGARIRRADCLASARRHLRVYRPTILIVDMGLPDGSGDELIAETAGASHVPVVLGLSGNPELEAAARAAGADGFLAKPVESLAAFQLAVLDALGPEAAPVGPRDVSAETVMPDQASLAQDLLNAADLLREAESRDEVNYLAAFLRGVAITAHDGELKQVAEAIRPGRLDELAALLRRRLGTPVTAP